MRNKNSDQDSSAVQSLLKGLSSHDFLTFGMQEIAYIKPITLKGIAAFAVHAADGTPLSIMDTLNDALLAVKQNDLEAVVVH
jgi:hypothetical protein